MASIDKQKAKIIYKLQLSVYGGLPATFTIDESDRLRGIALSKIYHLFEDDENISSKLCDILLTLLDVRERFA